MAPSRITVVGLGPAGAELLTVETADLLRSDLPVWLRTSRHRAAGEIESTGSFDHLYETLDSFDDVYATIVSSLVDLAIEHDHVIYAVPGSPVVAERTVEMLRVNNAVTAGEIDLDIRPALAFTELCWTALGIDPMTEAATIIDAFELGVHGVGRLGPLLITQVHSAEVLSEIIDVLDDVAPPVVKVLRRLGSPDEAVFDVPWSDLRSEVEPDHLTSLWIPRFGTPLASSIVELDEKLRSQVAASPHAAAFSFESLRIGLAKSAVAVSDAVDRFVEEVPDAGFDLEEGLADLLILVMLHVRLSAEAGLFTLDDLAETARKRDSASNGS